MDGLDYWRICDELSIIQAALLVAECDPSSEKSYVEDWKAHERPLGYEAAKTAISNALRRGAIKGRLIPHYDTDINGYRTVAIEDSINYGDSTIEVESLRTWLAGRGVKTGFFFPNAADAPDYLDPQNPRYALKLAAAVRAWLAVTDPNGKHPKQALTKWLREHAVEFGLTDDEGNPNETGIDDIAKIANWQPGGGAPKTPGK